MFSRRPNRSTFHIIKFSPKITIFIYTQPLKQPCVPTPTIEVQQISNQPRHDFGPALSSTMAPNVMGQTISKNNDDNLF